ncbi:hypothetical protein [Mycoplasma marinum]|uniref:HTH marR-type domain-containing protein n=1 Tax=Mycoplasma marinum TaxID=1937190 RepID=A0A4R0XMW2_9MOLU|nr:hypothetical protein [Mycoplasma marinum]TCG10812.1 hypothetical protein C4B24_03730 [Mycoplasma marinum]
MKKDFFNNKIPSYTHFMWKLDHISLKMKETFASEFLAKLQKFAPSLHKNDLYIINSIIFEEKVTKKSIADFLKKDPGNVSRNIDALIENCVIEKEITKIDNKKKVFLSIKESFYKKYIVLAHEFAERTFKIHFIKIINELNENSDSDDLKAVTQILEELKYKHDNK